MSNNKQTQTIDLQPLFDTLKECGFTDLTEQDEAQKKMHLFNYELSLHYNIIKANILMTHTSDEIVLEIDIARKIGYVENIQLNNPSLLTKKDIMRMIYKKIELVLEDVRKAAFTNLNQIAKF